MELSPGFLFRLYQSGRSTSPTPFIRFRQGPQFFTCILTISHFLWWLQGLAMLADVQLALLRLTGGGELVAIHCSEGGHDFRAVCLYVLHIALIVVLLPHFIVAA